MGVVPAYRRGVAAGARTLLQNTGAVLSIAFVMAIVTSAIPKATLFAIFSGVTSGLSAAKLDPFIANMHVALWVLSAVSLAGAGVCLLRPSHAAPATGVENRATLVEELAEEDAAAIGGTVPVSEVLTAVDADTLPQRIGSAPRGRIRSGTTR
jgi:hypothetical protein